MSVQPVRLQRQISAGGNSWTQVKHLVQNICIAAS